MSLSALSPLVLSAVKYLCKSSLRGGTAKAGAGKGRLVVCKRFQCGCGKTGGAALAPRAQ